MEQDELRRNFKNPPKGYGEVAFFWWQGDKVTRDKLRWILGQLRQAHIAGLQLNYCHGDTGGQQWGLTMPADPKPLTEPWWELFGWLLDECRPYGIALSLSDYTLGAPGQGFYTDEVLAKYPEMTGQELVLEDGQVRARTKPYSLNPMAPGVGEAICDTFYGEFERRFPGECGKGINFFFSDELNFNIRGRLWCDDFAQEFRRRKGYELEPVLPLLFGQTSPEAVKTRLDYYDVAVQLSEERYFKPCYDWHASRGMTFGCDHGGRGKDVTEFGDYFRTMRWNGGPGNDQPHLQSDLIKNKVSASICHLYGRRRTWLEGFYGSGWGTSSAQVADAVFRNFAMGHNLLSLHGLYYSMHGSMWEWAPPCNHYHMPYWQEMPALLACTERLSWLLSQGTFCCDTAIVYPVADAEADAEHGALAVQTAFSAGQTLYREGIDFDFLDFESIVSSRLLTSPSRLAAGDARYRAVVLPDMRAVRYEMLEKLVLFAESGGIVVVLGDLPKYSDRLGRGMELMTRRLARRAIFARPETLPEVLHAQFTVDFFAPPKAGAPYFQHRRLGEDDLYFVYGLPQKTRCFFRASGTALLLNAWTGEIDGCVPSEQTGGGVTLELPRRETEPNLLLFTEQPVTGLGYLKTGATVRYLDVRGPWRCKLRPTLDNRYGDYRLPAFDGLLGPEIRAAKARATEDDCSAADYPDEDWEEARLGFGPRGFTASDLAVKLPDEACRAMEAPAPGFSPCVFSRRFGLMDDAGPQGSYHGLKGVIGPDQLSFGERHVLRLGSDAEYTGEGGWYFFTWVCAESDRTVHAACGALQPDRLFVNHEAADPAAIRLHRGLNPLLAHFGACGRTHLVLLGEGAFAQRTPLASRWYENPFVCEYDGNPQLAGKPCWFRFQSPPGMKSMTAETDAEIEAFSDGVPMSRSGSVFYPATYHAEPVQIALRLVQKPRAYLGGAIEEPIRFTCGEGSLQPGDWSRCDALRCYSGGILFERDYQLHAFKDEKVLLDLGDVVSSAEVFVNDRLVSTLCAPPFTAELTGALRPGKNKVGVLVHNTLANHMSTIPTAYHGPLRSGFLLEEAEK